MRSVHVLVKDTRPHQKGTSLIMMRLLIIPYPTVSLALMRRWSPALYLCPKMGHDRSAIEGFNPSSLDRNCLGP